MKFAATIVAISVAAVSSFAPAATFVRTTALQAHFFSGYKTQVVPPPPVHGYSGFGHATCEAADVQFFAAPVVFAPPEPVFSGFGRSTEQMGGSPSIMSAPGAARARPSAPASFASYISSL